MTKRLYIFIGLNKTIIKVRVKDISNYLNIIINI